jgi:hypothetical protein
MASELTAVAADSSPEAVKPAREKRVSKRLSEAIRLLLTGECKTQKAAAERVHMNASHFCEAMQKPHVRVFIERRMRETIAAGTMRASARLVELLDAGSEHVSLDASKHVLAIAGIKPAADTQVSVNIDIKAGYVIDLSEPGEHKTLDLRAIPGNGP